jgi:YVTN family beta-propeller protein
MDKIFRLAPVLTLGWGVAATPAFGDAGDTAPVSPPAVNQSVPGGENVHVREGVAVEFSLAPLDGRGAKLPGVTEGEAALLQFNITDAASRAPLRGGRPAVWIDRRKGTPISCREKINAFLQGSLAYRPDLDLSRYFVVTLNDTASVSIIDPLLGLGTSKLLARVPLPAPGADWVLDRDEKRLFVAVPEADTVAVVDTVTWQALPPLSVGIKPRRLAFQPDFRYLWAVGADDEAGKGELLAIDTESLRVVARLPVGAGPTGITFTEDSAYAFAADPASGTLYVIDVRGLAIIKEIKLGMHPKGLAYSVLSRTVYVVGEDADAIVAVDGQSHHLVKSIKASRGMSAVRFTPDGRWGFLPVPGDRRVQVLDASLNRIVHSIDIGATPDQVSFSRNFAYIRSADSEQVSMVSLDALGSAGDPPVSRFAGGRSAPAHAGQGSRAAAIVPSPEGNAVLVANPPDRTIYYYMEGMAAPMGSFQNYGQAPTAVLAVDQGLREHAPGQYSARVSFPDSGTYDVAFLLDAPRFYHCFTTTIAADPLKQPHNGPVLRVEYLIKDRAIRVGEAARLRFRLVDRASGEPRSGLNDVKVLALLAPGVWQRREAARSVGEGLYEVELAAPRAGVYYVFVESPSLNVGYNKLPALILQARDQ